MAGEAAGSVREWVGREELVSERVAGSVLPKVLTSFDMVAIFVAIVLFVPNGAVIQAAGPGAFAWWLLGFLAFLIPGAIVTGQLGRMFPGEGSIYLWTYKAFGSFWGFFAGFCAWWPGVLVMVVTGTLTISYLGYLFPGTVGSWSVAVQGLAIMALIGGASLVAVLRFRLTQNMVNAVFVLYSLAIALLLLGGVAWLASGHPARVHPEDLAAYAPGAPTGVNLGNWTFFGLVVLALLGVEVPLNMGVEVKETRSVTRHLLWGTIAVMVAYLVVTWAIMVVVPPAGGRSAAITAVAEAAGLSLGGWAGKAIAAVLAVFFLFNTVVYNYSFARLIFVSGLDRQLPKWMCHLNANKVPDTAVWTQTIVSALFVAVAFVVLPDLKVGGSAPLEVQTKVYDVLLGSVTVIWCLSMVVLFVDLPIIRRRYPEAFAAARLAHPAVFWACSIVGAAAAAVGIVATLSGSWAPTLIANDHGSVRLFGAAVSYGPWAYWVGGVALASLLLAAWLFQLGRRVQRGEL